ncbi:sigma-54-dependent Fis family transcriptional regulator [candidate division KSB1 bacterium]|nr:sigma-54-dependent Fis family transcriptional regulator [candidate division KSB1 bacterium]RQW00165.1 MAG: sigma-54-dependent Fis family transcriptional regulator [candidate division KSB1 bacterium]
MKNQEAKILIVDDEAIARYAMRKALESMGVEIREAPDGEVALKEIQIYQPDVVLCDINMPKLNGLELLKLLRTMELKRDIPPFIVVVTAYGSEKIAVEAMKAGAFDYLSKPYDIDELRLLVKKILDQIALKRENIALKNQVAQQKGGTIIGSSAAIQKVLRLIDKVAPTDVTVLITGESGTGKELVAHTIHQASHRADGPYVTMNCAAIPKDLVESELFGHEKGAFTGATDRRLGKFELAHNGTLFLDEIADMSLDTQAKILRVLEQKSFTRLGGKDMIRADVRLISATNKDLAKEIERGAFRQDLYYRLKVLELELPPLNKRREDIPLLAQHYLHLFAQRHQKSMHHISSRAMRLLANYHWPGNVRQLIHVIEQSIVLAEGEKLDLDDLPLDIQRTEPADVVETKEDYAFGEKSFTELKDQVVHDFEKKMIKKALLKSNGNVSQAARLLKMKRQFLQAKMKSLGIERMFFINFSNK